MTIDHAKLRKLAEDATPGPWECRNEYLYYKHGKHGGCLGDTYAETDAAFIAAANPATVLALLDEIEALRATLAEKERELEFELNWHIERLNEAESRLTKVRELVAPMVEAAERVSNAETTEQWQVAEGIFRNEIDVDWVLEIGAALDDE